MKRLLFLFPLFLGCTTTDQYPSFGLNHWDAVSKNILLFQENDPKKLTTLERLCHQSQGQCVFRQAEYDFKMRDDLIKLQIELADLQKKCP